MHINDCKYLHGQPGYIARILNIHVLYRETDTTTTWVRPHPRVTNGLRWQRNETDLTRTGRQRCLGCTSSGSGCGAYLGATSSRGAFLTPTIVVSMLY